MTSVTGDPVVAQLDIMRDVAHELRQPLGTIESIAYYLSLVLPPDDEKTHDQLRRMQDLVEQSEWILSNGVHLSETLKASPQQIDVAELITEIITARSWRADCAPRLDFDAELPLANVDPGLGRALLSNLLTLFRQLSTESAPLSIRTCIHQDGIAIEMSTAAPGYRSEASLGAGAALSLECARRVTAVHRGGLECFVDPISGVRVRVMLP